MNARVVSLVAWVVGNLTHLVTMQPGSKARVSNFQPLSCLLEYNKNNFVGCSFLDRFS